LFVSSGVYLIIAVVCCYFANQKRSKVGSTVNKEYKRIFDTDIDEARHLLEAYDDK